MTQYETRKYGSFELTNEKCDSCGEYTVWHHENGVRACVSCSMHWHPDREVTKADIRLMTMLLSNLDRARIETNGIEEERKYDRFWNRNVRFMGRPRDYQLK